MAADTKGGPTAGDGLPSASHGVARARALELGRRTSPPAGCEVEERGLALPGGERMLRCYRPAYRPAYRPGAEGLRAGLVFFHAGGFVAGDYASHAAFCGQLCLDSGCVIVACDYRLAPEHPFPGALDDAYFAACHVHEHADAFGIDHRRLGVGGIEVGGGLATGVARLAKERRNPALALQLLLCPTLDARAPAEAGSGVSLYARSEREREDPRCSPVLARNLIGLPPAWIVCAGALGASDAAESYAGRLRAAYVAVELVRVGGSGCEFLDLPDGSDASRAALRASCEALGRALDAAGDG